MRLVIVIMERVVDHLSANKTQQRKGNPWGKTLKERSEETACKIAY